MHPNKTTSQHTATQVARAGRGPLALLMSLMVFAITANAIAEDATQMQKPDPAMVAAARTISKELGANLKAQLQNAIKAGGPIAALNVCHTAAGPIAADLTAKYQGHVGRTALKVRNPKNKPDAFETKILERFTKEARDGADPKTLEYAEIVDQSGKRTFRYMKAIPMVEKPCAACHGAAIKPKVLDRIRALYPDDQATGFKPGGIRGAFTITKAID